ncbi:hypothetical protein E2C01_077125 [Portunus trituberculatus]|uniref:Uncharacterized protein n=1 Tax=Portunus trituberculatus TaxID=210409 RepID=A0A5B7ILD3_PORTR|nr:hypothetical protein [Portunus trituberculatus]
MKFIESSHRSPLPVPPAPLPRRSNLDFARRAGQRSKHSNDKQRTRTRTRTHARTVSRSQPTRLLPLQREELRGVHTSSQLGGRERCVVWVGVCRVG